MEVVVNVIPDILNLTLQLLSTLILFLVMKKLFWNKVKDLIAARQDYMDSEVQNAVMQNEEANKNLLEAKQVIQQAREQAASIVSDSKAAANTVHNSIIENAKKESDMMKKNTKDSIELEKARFYDELKNEVIDIAVATATKIINEEIDESKHKSILDNYIEEVS